ncbi:MAG: hypothetical protein HYY06_10340 [Deltaproteobacteria bacterium]|nr:hypothetical protein [Deltaproteobacteria bacterium]
MSDLPHGVLSEQLQERLRGRRLVSAIFVTFQFDPGFFEQEVLPVLLDVPLSHAAAIRLVQLEDAIRTVPGQIAVYYDANGLVASDAGSAKLDVQRVPVRHRTGIFHPKNAFLLVEETEVAEDGSRPRALLVAATSANLTRAGWWENLEACHFEELTPAGRTRLKDDLVDFLELLRRKASAESRQDAVSDVLRFLRGTEQRVQRSTDDRIHAHFYSGRQSLPDFLSGIAGSRLVGTYLEVISPYFDDADDCAPLRELIERFHPSETRVFLPRSPAGEGLCRPEFYEAVRSIPGVGWGRLPRDLLRLGRSDELGLRFVHAKVYRFFTKSPKRELCFVGSPNLTSPAHQTGGNLETGFLVDLDLPRAPSFWMEADERKPRDFQPQCGVDGLAASGGTRLELRYHWDLGKGETYWDSPGDSPALRLEARGVALGQVGPLPSRTWVPLKPDVAERLRDVLSETSFLEVIDLAGVRGLLLVQEEGMSHKPSLLMRLSPSDILRYWSLLTQEQRNAFLEARAPELALVGADLVARARLVVDNRALCDRFASFFHAFNCLERTVRQALERGAEREAVYRLFGRKYDSLLSLLERILAGEGPGDAVDRYVILLCARQLCTEVARAHAEFWSVHRADVREIEAALARSSDVRSVLVATNPDEMPAFLEWFDRWFVRRAAPVEVES